MADELANSEVPEHPLSGIGSLEGRVTDAETGLDLPFVDIEVYDALGNYVISGDSHYDGYRINNLEPGAYFVRTATTTHFDQLYEDMPCPLEICDITKGTPVQVNADSSTTGIDFALARGGRILGNLTDADSGLPLRREPVSVFNALGERVRGVRTDTAGNYLVGGLPTGTYYVRVSPELHLTELYDDIVCPLGTCTVTGGTPVAVTFGGDTPGVDFAVETGGRISGQFRDEATELPISYGFVSLFNAVGHYVASSGVDDGGNYLIGGLPPGNYFAIGTGFFDYVSELYDGLPCHNMSCDPSLGTVITVEESGETTGIDFVLSTESQPRGLRLNQHAGLIVPFSIDRTNPNGRTTLFAVHNTSSLPRRVQLSYHEESIYPIPICSDVVTLGPNATLTVNVRDSLSCMSHTVDANPLEGIVLITEGNLSEAPNLTGDFFSLDSANAFASGERLVRASDLCNRQRIRFVDFGSGTEFQLLLNEPQYNDMPSFSYSAYSETGELVGSGNYFSFDHLVVVDRSVFSSQPFGVLDIDFGNAFGGHISATFSAFGQFSVSLGGECQSPFPTR